MNYFDEHILFNLVYICVKQNRNSYNYRNRKLENNLKQKQIKIRNHENNWKIKNNENKIQINPDHADYVGTFFSSCNDDDDMDNIGKKTLLR